MTETTSQIEHEQFGTDTPDVQSCCIADAAHCIVAMYNGKKDGEATSPKGSHVTFTSAERLQVEAGCDTWSLVEGVRVRIIEDVAPFMAKAICQRASYIERMSFADLTATRPDGSLVTIGEQVELQLRRDLRASEHLLGEAIEEPEHIWINHLYRLGQLSFAEVTPGEGYLFLDDPCCRKLADLYDECAKVLLQFWSHFVTLANGLARHRDPVQDPALPLIPLIFNKRFSEK